MSIFNKLFSFKADFIDITLIKASVFTATLFLAKIWSPILSLEWYWYLIILIIAVIRPLNNFFKWMSATTK